MRVPDVTSDSYNGSVGACMHLHGRSSFALLEALNVVALEARQLRVLSMKKLILIKILIDQNDGQSRVLSYPRSCACGRYW